MNTNTVKLENQAPVNKRVNPKMFMLWLSIISISMIFAGLTSAYVVRKADGNWLDFKLPMAFTISTVLLVLSSVTMHWSLFAAKKNELGQLKLALGITTLLGAGFVYSQYIGFSQMADLGLYFVGNISSSFVIAITAIHILHLVVGILFLIATFVAAMRFKIHSKNLIQIQLCTTYWHFLDILWIYLFLFLTFYK